MHTHSGVVLTPATATNVGMAFMSMEEGLLISHTGTYSNSEPATLACLNLKENRDRNYLSPQCPALNTAESALKGAWSSTDMKS